MLPPQAGWRDSPPPFRGRGKRTTLRRNRRRQVERRAAGRSGPAGRQCDSPRSTMRAGHSRSLGSCEVRAQRDQLGLSTSQGISLSHRRCAAPSMRRMQRLITQRGCTLLSTSVFFLHTAGRWVYSRPARTCMPYGTVPGTRSRKGGIIYRTGKYYRYSLSDSIMIPYTS